MVGGLHCVHVVHCALDLVHPRRLVLPCPLCRGLCIILVVALKVSDWSSDHCWFGMAVCPILKVRAAQVLESQCHTTHGRVIVGPCHGSLQDLKELRSTAPVQQCTWFCVTMKIPVRSTTVITRPNVHDLQDQLSVPSAWPVHQHLDGPQWPASLFLAQGALLKCLKSL